MSLFSYQVSIRELSVLLSLEKNSAENDEEAK